MPKRFVDDHEEFKRAGNMIKIGFWVVGITFVSLCHKIKLLTKILGDKTWRMFAFKIALVAFPLTFLDKV